MDHTRPFFCAFSLPCSGPHCLTRESAQVSVKHLENVRLNPPSTRPGIIGSVERKNKIYDVWAHRRDHPAHQSENAHVPGEEMGSLSVLLPRSEKGGKLYQGA